MNDAYEPPAESASLFIFSVTLLLAILLIHARRELLRLFRLAELPCAQRPLDPRREIKLACRSNPFDEYRLKTKRMCLVVMVINLGIQPVQKKPVVKNGYW